jgi:hypothetical protein
VSTAKAEPTQKFEVDLARTFRTSSLSHKLKGVEKHGSAKEENIQTTQAAAQGALEN